MHDERLNLDSFLKRGSPDQNHLPSLSGNANIGAGASLFCHTCRTNQTLLVNLLAAYLPAASDPTYASRSAALPAYRAALYTRYPPVCSACAPAVDEEIARRDEMARTRALGGALQVSNASLRRPGVARERNLKNVDRKTTRGASLLSWRVRGVLWSASFLVALLGYVVGALDIRMPSRLWTFTPILPIFVLISITWTFWDPTYSLQQRSNVQGRKVLVEGRQMYIIMQSHAWMSRLVTSVLLASSRVSPECDLLYICGMIPGYLTYDRRKIFFCGSLVLEIIVFIMSYFSITIHKPAPVRLIDTSAHRALSSLPDSGSAPGSQSHASGTHVNISKVPDSQAGMSEPDLFATLSLSSRPILPGAFTATNPMFGQPSFSIKSEAASLNNNSFDPAFKGAGEGYDNDNDSDGTDTLRRNRARDPDAMDWEPASPAVARSKINNRTEDDGSWLRRQRFFPPEEPTGLESLFMRTRLVDEDDAQISSSHRHVGFDGTVPNVCWHWGWGVYSASALPVIVLLGGLWLSERLRS
ncbi:hypothetical protein EW145_g1520 [Phellinidium pouzarii]|uniref:Ima1 N-terminal domain-containing protein n=1 Tax=Phellinidium pouzarii TaxID=167371 RepID=A0A4S4LET2_9AGAM|nr:hypothetical protein EW145_g1520 [Phellinidium pouzarii]